MFTRGPLRRVRTSALVLLIATFAGTSHSADRNVSSNCVRQVMAYEIKALTEVRLHTLNVCNGREIFAKARVTATKLNAFANKSNAWFEKLGGVKKVCDPDLQVYVPFGDNALISPLPIQPVTTAQIEELAYGMLRYCDGAVTTP
jgi:hypothetical protein